MANKYQEILSSIASGSIDTSSPETQREYLSLLCNIRQPMHNHPEDVIIGITINHVAMRQHINKLNEQNKKTQLLVMALAIAALLTSGTQIYYARRADIRAAQLSSKNEPRQQPSTMQAATPFQNLPPSSYQAILQNLNPLQTSKNE